MSYLFLESQTMVARCLRRSLRDPEAFFTALTLPVILLLLFVYVFGGAITHGGHYANYVVPGLIVLCAGFGAGTTAVAVATDMANGIVDRFRSLPIASATVLIGHVTASLVRNLTATALVVGVGFAVGWRPTATPLQWLGALVVIIVLILAMSWIAAAVGMFAGGPEAASSFTIMLMFLPYVSTAFVPARTMPSVLRGFASHQPFTPIIETIRGLWMGHTSTGVSTGHEALIALAWSLGLLATGIGLASWRFARQHGPR